MTLVPVDCMHVILLVAHEGRQYRTIPQGFGSLAAAGSGHHVRRNLEFGSAFVPDMVNFSL